MAEFTQLDPKHIDALAQELRVLLEDELSAGNRVVETHHGWPGQDSILVMLERPFIKKPDPLPPGVVFREVNDPHWWKAEYEHEGTRHILACRYCWGGS
jgi:hypothetical protein